MQEDRQISLGCVIAVTLWVVAVLCALSGTVAAFATNSNDYAPALALMVHALLLAAGAATWTVRMFFRQQNRLLRLAWELGNEGRGPVRRMKP